MRVVFLTAISLLLGMLYPKSIVAQVSVSANGLSVQAGETVRIPIMIDNVDGLDVTSYQFTWAYAGDVLDIITIETSGTLSEGTGLTTNLEKPGEVSVAAAGIQALEGSGVLLELVAIAKGDDLFGERIFTPEYKELLLFNSQGTPVDVQPSNGSFSVRGAEVSFLTPNVPSGSRFVMPITLANLPAPGAFSYQFILDYDADVISISSASKTGSLSEPGSITVNTNTPGRIQVAYAGTAPLMGSGDLLYLNGERITDSEPSLFLSTVYFFNDNGEQLAVFPSELEAQTPILAGAPNEDIILNIPIETPGIELNAYQFELTYDPAIVTISGTRTAGTVSRGQNLVSNTNIPGRIAVSWAGAEPIEGTGPLISLEATIIQSGSPNFQYTDFKLIGSPGDGIGANPVRIPDLLVENLEVSPNPVIAGEELNIQFTIKNQGNGDAQAFQTNVRLGTSSDEVRENDLLLYTCQLDELSTDSETDACASTIVLPATTFAGEYYVWVITDTQSEAGQDDESNDRINTALSVLGSTGAFVHPVSDAAVTRGYAEYVDADSDGDFEYHAGIDFISTSGNLDIAAAAQGTVRTLPVGTYGSEEEENFGLGNVIIIDHTDALGVYTLYAHLESILVSDGQEVEAGDIIGIMGNTGFTTGENGIHLHFEVKDRGVLSGNRTDTANPFAYTSLDPDTPPESTPNVPGHPNKFGFHDPLSFIQLPIELVNDQVAIEVVSSSLEIRSAPNFNQSAVLGTTPNLGSGELSAFVASRRIGNEWYQIHIPNMFTEGWSASGWISGTQNGTVFSTINNQIEQIEATAEFIPIFESANDQSEQVAFAYGEGLPIPQRFAVLESAPGWYRIVLSEHQSNGDGWVRAENVFEVAQTTTISTDNGPLDRPRMGRNYPNPFATQTTIPLHFAEPTQASLSLYDILGRETRVLLNNTSLTGEHLMNLDGSDLPGGTYILVLQTKQSLHRQLITIAR